jgi:hypothetical protein
VSIVLNRSKTQRSCADFADATYRPVTAIAVAKPSPPARKWPRRIFWSAVVLRAFSAVGLGLLDEISTPDTIKRERAELAAAHNGPAAARLTLFVHYGTRGIPFTNDTDGPLDTCMVALLGGYQSPLGKSNGGDSQKCFTRPSTPVLYRSTKRMGTGVLCAPRASNARERIDAARPQCFGKVADPASRLSSNDPSTCTAVARITNVRTTIAVVVIASARWDGWPLAGPRPVAEGYLTNTLTKRSGRSDEERSAGSCGSFASVEVPAPSEPASREPG